MDPELLKERIKSLLEKGETKRASNLQKLLDKNMQQEENIAAYQEYRKNHDRYGNLY